MKRAKTGSREARLRAPQKKYVSPVPTFDQYADDIIKQMIVEHEAIVRENLGGKPAGRSGIWPRQSGLPPSQRRLRWVNVAVKAISIAKLRELAAYHNKPQSQLLTQYIDEAFDKVLKEPESKETMAPHGTVGIAR